MFFYSCSWVITILWRVSIGCSLVFFTSSWLAWAHGISFSVSSSSLRFLQKRAASSSLLKSSVSIGEFSGRGSMDEVSKKTNCSETGFCHVAEELLRQDCSFDSMWISSVATERFCEQSVQKMLFWVYISPLTVRRIEILYSGFWNAQILNSGFWKAKILKSAKILNSGL